jgi:hypothetical protein
MHLNLPHLDMVFSRFLKVFYFCLWSTSVFFPPEISPFFNKESGKFLEIFFPWHKLIYFCFFVFG